MTANFPLCDDAGIFDLYYSEFSQATQFILRKQILPVVSQEMEEHIYRLCFNFVFKWF